MNTKLFLVLTAFLLIFCLAFAGENQGLAGAQFLKKELDAKWSAIGGVSSIVNDAASLFYNPAGLSEMEKSQIKMSGIKMSGLSNFEEEYYSSLVYSQPVLSYGTAALGIMYDNLSFANIPVWDASVNLGYSYKYALKKYGQISGGISTKYLHQSISIYHTNGIAFDLGCKYTSPVLPIPYLKNLHLLGGFSLLNLSWMGMKFISVADPLPLTLKVGGGFMWQITPEQALLFGNDVIFFSDDIPDYRAGAEYLYLFEILKKPATAAVRLGIKTNNQKLGWFSNLSAGLGISYDNTYDFDYAFISNGDLGQSHRITLSVKFDAFNQKGGTKNDETQRNTAFAY